MPMNEAADFAGQDTSKDYCFHCAKKDGTMKSYEEVLEGSIVWAMSEDNFKHMGFEAKPTEDEMRQAITEHMATLPAWKKNVFN